MTARVHDYRARHDRRKSGKPSTYARCSTPSSRHTTAFDLARQANSTFSADNMSSTPNGSLPRPWPDAPRAGRTTITGSTRGGVFGFFGHGLLTGKLRAVAVGSRVDDRVSYLTEAGRQSVWVLRDTLHERARELLLFLAFIVGDWADLAPSDFSGLPRFQLVAMLMPSHRRSSNGGGTADRSGEERARGCTDSLQVLSRVLVATTTPIRYGTQREKARKMSRRRCPLWGEMVRVELERRTSSSIGDVERWARPRQRDRSATKRAYVRNPVSSRVLRGRFHPHQHRRRLIYGWRACRRRALRRPSTCAMRRYRGGRCRRPGVDGCGS